MNKKEDVPKTPERPSNVNQYFTKEVNDQVNEMTEKEMESVMRDIISTRYWIAMLKYRGMRMPILDATMRGTDPVKDPSKISWAQGAMAGLCDIESYVIDLNAPSNEPTTEESESESDSHRPEGVIG